MRKKTYTPLVQDFIDDLERMNEMYQIRKYKQSDQLEKSLSKRLSDIKCDYATSITFPFSEGDTYYTIEKGEVVESCWDDQSEEIFMANLNSEYESTVSYFMDVEDAYIAMRREEVKSAKKLFMQAMKGKPYDTLDPQERTMIGDFLERFNKIGENYINE